MTHLTKHLLLNKNFIILCLFLSACSKGKNPGKEAIVGTTDSAKSGESDTNKIVEKGELTLAAAEGDLFRVLDLLSLGADVNENIGTEVDHLTPLIAALAFGQEKVAWSLIENGASLDATYNSFTPREIIQHKEIFGLQKFLNEEK